MMYFEVAWSAVATALVGKFKEKDGLGCVVGELVDIFEVMCYWVKYKLWTRESDTRKIGTIILKFSVMRRKF